MSEDQTTVPLSQDVVELRADNKRIWSGLMRVVQANNQCKVTGASCRDAMHCGCHLEAERWCEDE